MLDLSRRLDAPEIMDTEPVPLSDMRSALRFLARTNRWFGGHKPVLRYFEEWSARWRPGSTIRVLDVGTGGGDTLRALARWGRAKNVKLVLHGIDLMPDVIVVAKEGGAHENITFSVDNFFEIPAQDQYDYVIANLFLHHMPLDGIVPVLQKLDAHASRGLLVTDLERSLAGFGGVLAASYLLGNRVVRHDGPRSVQRAFRSGELDALAKAAGLTYLQARREAWFRLSLAGEKLSHEK